jgi:hypothetical protein
VQRDHLHLIVEAEDTRSLSRAMQGLSVRIAKALNRALGRKGKVFADRFHDRVLTSPKQVRHALAYVLCNARKHGVAPPIRGGAGPSWVDPCSSAGLRWLVPQGLLRGLIATTSPSRPPRRRGSGCCGSAGAAAVCSIPTTVRARAQPWVRPIDVRCQGPSLRSAQRDDLGGQPARRPKAEDRAGVGIYASTSRSRFCEEVRFA